MGYFVIMLMKTKGNYLFESQLNKKGTAFLQFLFQFNLVKLTLI